MSEEPDSRVWVFQYDPNYYDMRSYVRDYGLSDHWTAMQNKRHMKSGDVVYILRAGGRDGGIHAHIEAVASLASSVYANETETRDRKPYRIWLRYEQWIDPAITRAEMQRDDVLRTFHALAVGQSGTNFLLPPEVAERLSRLIEGRLRPMTAFAAEADASAQGGAVPPGQEYRPANDAYPSSERISVEVDPERVARANRAHADVQNRLARHLRANGLEPLSPNGGPNYDIAWRHGDTILVAEIKSLTNENEETQLRLGLAQVLMYRHLLAQQHSTVRAVLVPEREPSNPTWQELCADLGVLLAWPDVWEQLL